MHDFLIDFIQVLREHGVRVSTAETLDAARTLRLIGYADKTTLQTALAAVLAKTKPEKEIFHACFEAFFTFSAFFTKEKTESSSLFAAIQENLADISRNLLENDRPALITALAAASNDVSVNEISLPTQKGLFQGRMMEAMGFKALDADILYLQKGGSGAAQGLAATLADRREQLVDQIRRFVDSRYDLYAKARMENLLERHLLHQNLSSIEERDFELMNSIVKKIVKRMNDVHSRRKRIDKKGALDVKRTIRLNLKYNSVPFHLQWKRKKIERPDVVVLCDISRSMRQVVRFFLMFLYNLNREIVRIRSFAFCSNLAEVSHLFDHFGVAEGVARLENGCDGSILLGRTDYGQALRDFTTFYGACLSGRTTVIVLGDGRNNFDNPETGLFKRIGERSKRIVWLNPEASASWGTGDSVMKHYLPFCHGVRECNTLFQLERAIDALLA